MARSDRLLQVALRSVPIFRSMPKTGGASVLATVSHVTGVPLLLLARAERLVAATGSLQPLQALLASPQVPKASDLRFELDVHYTSSDLGRAHQEVEQCMTLVTCSSRGQAALTLAVTLERSAASATTDRQSVRVLLKWLLDTPTTHQACKHEMTVAGDRPRRLPYAAAA